MPDLATENNFFLFGPRTISVCLIEHSVKFHLHIIIQFAYELMKSMIMLFRQNEKLATVAF